MPAGKQLGRLSNRFEMVGSVAYSKAACKRTSVKRC